MTVAESGATPNRPPILRIAFGLDVFPQYASIFSKAFLPLSPTETDAESLNTCIYYTYAFRQTENGYEEGLFRGACFRRGISETLQLTQNAESISPRRFEFL